MSLRTLSAAAVFAFAAFPATAQEIPIASAPIEMVADLAEVLGRAHAVRTIAMATMTPPGGTTCST